MLHLLFHLLFQLLFVPLFQCCNGIEGRLRSEHDSFTHWDDPVQ
jgi:hypothetical protein